MIGQHFVWWLLTIACVVWYCTITVYVAIRGSVDIKEMLARLRDQSTDSPESRDDGPSQESGPQS